MTAGSIVDEFIHHLVRKDLDAALTLVTDDVEYDNVPMGKVFGPDGIRTALGGFLAGAGEIDWVIHHQVESADTVMNERLDRFQMGGKWVEIPVAGLFVLHGGRIALWRDYFDQATFRDQLIG